MYTIKQGVSIFMSPELEKILAAVCLVYAAFHVPVVITSGIDGPHREGSLHFCFRAIDIRKNFKDDMINVIWEMHRKTMIECLGNQFRIRKLQVAIVEELDHLHIEWIGP